MSSPLKAVDPYIDIERGREIARGVWVFEDVDLVPLRPNTAIVVGAHSVLVIDTGLGPENGERMLSKARELGGDRRIYLTTTHFHPEHAFGAQVFRNVATIFYNRSQEVELVERGAWYLNRFKTIFSPKVRAMLEPVELTRPHFTYSGDSMELDLGGRRVCLRNWGLAHTFGDQTVFLPDERILFTGDLLENRIFPIFPWLPPDDVRIDGNNWISSLNAFLELDPLVVVPGHGHIGDRALVEEVVSFHQAMRARVWGLRRSGETLAGAIPIVTSEMNAAFGWEQPFWLQKAVEYWWTVEPGNV